MKRNQSPGRPKSPARKKSPGRTKSPARKSPARKSPARKPSKSPSRKKAPVPQKSVSPAAEKDMIIDRMSTEREVIKNKSPNTVEVIKRGSEDFIASIRNSRSRESSRTLEEIRLSATRTLISGPNYNIDSSSGGITRRSSRLKSAPKELDGMKKGIDEEVEKLLKSNHVQSSDYTIKSNPQEFGGRFGALFLIIFMPAFVLALQLSCVNKDKCKLLDFYISTNWKFYLDPYAALWFIGFVFWQCLLSILPLYKKVTGIPPKNDALEYRCSGIVNCLLTLSLYGILYYLKYPVTVIVPKAIPILNSAVIFGLLVSIILFIKGGRPGVIQNSHAKTGSKIYDFWSGREINPRFGIFDVKQTLIRIAIVGSLLYDTAVIVRAVDNYPAKSNYTATILVVTGLQIFTLLDFLIFEEKFLTSFIMQHEGTGYMFVIGCCVFPFFISIIPKFLLLNLVDLNVYYLATLAVLYVLAYLIYRLSTNQKSNFRKNPLSPSVLNLETIPTIISGKKLLCGGWWGLVRQPNYLGLILMYWILATSASVSHLAPYAMALASTVVLVHRVIRNSGRCKTLYAGSWDRYTQKVKYHLVPRIF